MIIVATITPDYGFPAVANLLQDALAARNAAALDINSACTGFLAGLALADGMIVSGHINNVLLVGAETMSRVVDWSDRSTCVLFGDAAGAAVLQVSENGGGILKTLLGSDGSGAMSLFAGSGSRYPASARTDSEGHHYLKMDGREVYRFAVKAMIDSTRETVNKAGMSLDDFDLFIPHQANSRIIKSAIRELGDSGIKSLHQRRSLRKYVRRLDTRGSLRSYRGRPDKAGRQPLDGRVWRRAYLGPELLWNGPRQYPGAGFLTRPWTPWKTWASSRA